MSERRALSDRRICRGHRAPHAGRRRGQLPGWQQYIAQHGDFSFLSVAADMGGAAAARPWHEKAGATFTTVVDAENILG